MFYIMSHKDFTPSHKTVDPLENQVKFYEIYI